MTRPKYRDLQADRLTEAKLGEGANVRVIAGEASGGRLLGAVEGLAVAPQFLDVTLLPGTAFRETVPRGHTAFAYVDHGDLRFGPEQTAAHGPALVVFGDGDIVAGISDSPEQLCLWRSLLCHQWSPAKTGATARRFNRWGGNHVLSVEGSVSVRERHPHVVCQSGTRQS